MLKAGAIDPDDIIIDLATGVSGAGRSPKEGMLHSEVSEGYHAYNVAKHRHLAEFDQEFEKVAGRKVEVTFVPHLLPQNRGILATIYVRGEGPAIHAALRPRTPTSPSSSSCPTARRRQRGTCAGRTSSISG